MGELTFRIVDAVMVNSIIEARLKFKDSKAWKLDQSAVVLAADYCQAIDVAWHEFKHPEEAI